MHVTNTEVSNLQMTLGSWITAETTQTYDTKQLYSGETSPKNTGSLQLSEIFKDITIVLYKRGRSLKIY